MKDHPEPVAAIFPPGQAVMPAQRAALMGHAPCCIWLTGLSASGKTSLAHALERALHQRGCHTYALDGDNLRQGLNADLGFSAEARAEIERIDSNYDAAPMSLAAALPDPAAFDNDEHKWQPVALHGQYIGEPFLARNRPSAAGVGSNLVQAFRNDDGSIFFVDRGWVAVSGTDEVPSDLPLPAPGEVEALVRLRAGEPEIAGRSAAGHSLPSIHLPTLAELSLKAGYAAPGAVVYTAAFGQLVSEQPEGEHGLLAERPERDEGPHLSYALQWYVFILIACIGVAYAARLEYRGLNAGDESVRREDARRADRKRRRGPSDADEEDALLGG